VTEPIRPGQDMSEDRFAAILDAYGAEPRRWPAAERSAAERLLATSAEAQRLHAQAARLDRVLSAAVPPLPSPDLRAAILEVAPGRRRAPARQGSLWSRLIGVITGELGGPRLAGAVLGAALALGIVVGGAVGTGGAVDTEIDLVHLALLDEQFSGY